MKLVELGFDDFDKVLLIFSMTKHLSFTIDAVIAGNSPGRIWVDTPDDPSVAFLWDGYHCYYFVGTTNNKQFNTALKKLLFKEIIPKAIENDHEIFKIEYYPNEWELILEEMLREKLPVKNNRKFFTLNKLMIPKWKDILPPSFSVRKIGKNLLESDIKNVQSIIDEINQCWNSVDDFLEKGFGFCLVYTPKMGEEEIQGWCTGEYFSEGKCGIGIETFHGYRKRGFATAMASAFVEFSLSVNIHPHWDASANNEASLRVAKKVGFRRIQDYYVFFGALTNIESFQGNFYYQKKEFKTAAEWFEKAAELGQRKHYNHYSAACSWALDGEIDSALDNLNKSIDNLGKPSKYFINHVKSNTDLTNLHTTEGWKVILQRLDDFDKIGA